MSAVIAYCDRDRNNCGLQSNGTRMALDNDTFQLLKDSVQRFMEYMARVARGDLSGSLSVEAGRAAAAGPDGQPAGEGDAA